MLTIEQKFIIDVLRDFINKDKTYNIPSDLQSEVINSYAKTQCIQEILYYQCRMLQYENSYYITVCTYQKRQEMIDELLEEIHCPYCIIKGTEVASLYPIPWLRTMGDVDIVVPTEYREAVHNVFLKLNYQNMNRILFPDKEWSYQKNGIVFELHDRLMYLVVVKNDEQEAFLSQFWQYTSQNRLDWSFHFIYLVLHLRKHFMYRGVGFRQFMDITVMAKYADLNWDWIKVQAEKMGLLPFLQTVLTLCNRWFSLNTPLELRAMSEEFYETATKKVFEDGVFGFQNSENNVSHAVNLHYKGGREEMLKEMLRELFPPYHKLCVIPAYSWIIGKPYLLPFAWMYRISLRIWNIPSMKAKLARIHTDSESIKKREELYRQWGL